MVTYLTFRIKYCQPTSNETHEDSTHALTLLYRVHVFNFLYSLFTLASGYVIVTQNLATKAEEKSLINS